MTRRIVWIALYVAIIILLVIGIVLAFQSRVNAPDSKGPSTATNKRTTPVTKPTQGGSQTSQGTSGGQSSNGVTSNSQTSASAGAAVSRSGQAKLANSGPGSVVGLFVVTTVVGSISYRLRLQRSL